VLQHGCNYETNSVSRMWFGRHPDTERAAAKEKF
jgi:hypothetical protein